jgi:hypothetical protein
MIAGGGVGPDDDDGVSFAHALATLRERGSALLVVGSVPDETFATASATMLGDPSAEPQRRRLVVASERTSGSAIRRLRETGPVSAEYARFLTRGDGTRNAAAGSASPDEVTPRTHALEGSVGELGETIDGIIAEFALFAGGLDPAEFRMAFDCLPTLLCEEGRETAFRFLHVTIALVRSVSGMMHVRLPRDAESAVVGLFEPLFDATVELRIDGSGLEQRWRFRDRELTSEWLPVDGAP